MVRSRCLANPSKPATGSPSKMRPMPSIFKPQRKANGFSFASARLSHTPIMSAPIVAANKPIPVELKAGEEYHYCTCGKSANQPFAMDHMPEPSSPPKAFTATDDGEAYLVVASKQRTRRSAMEPTRKSRTIKLARSLS